MKVIGKTASGYLVEATESELNRLAGCRYGQNVPWAKAGSRPNGVPIGTEFDVSSRFDAMHNLTQAEGQVRQGAAALRALADLAEKSLPSAIVPPPAPAPESENA